MDFVAVMLFTQQVFHWEGLLLLFCIKSQPIVAYKSVVYKRVFNILVFESSKNEKITLPHEFIFVLSGISLRWYSWKSLAKSRGFWKNI